MVKTMRKSQTTHRNHFWAKRCNRFSALGYKIGICTGALMLGCSGAQVEEENRNPPTGTTNNPPVTAAVSLNDLPSSPLQGQVVINELSSQGDDEIEFLNLSSGPIDLSGWFYVDRGWIPGNDLTDDHRFVFPDGTMIDAASYLVVRKNEAHTFGLSGSGDALWLLDAERQVVDGVTWGLSEAEPSLCRLPNGMGDFETCAAKTLGIRNESSVMPTAEDAGLLDGVLFVDGGEDIDGGFEVDGGNDVVDADAGVLSRAIIINEVSSSGDDAIELKNVGQESIDLSGWYVTDDSYDPSDSATFDKRYDLPAGTLLQAGAYLTLYKTTDHAFGLGGDDAVFLYDLNDDLMDQCDWAINEAAVSYCRIPDGTGAFRSCSTTSFDALNIE